MRYIQAMAIGLWAAVAMAGDTAPRNLDWAAAAGQAGWRMTVRGPDGNTQELASETATRIGDGEAGHPSDRTWTASVGEASAQIHLADTPGEDGLRHLKLTARLPDGWTVVRTDWPVLANLGMVPGVKLAAPFGWGLEYDLKPGMGFEGTYPSLVISMPFVALYAGGKGLYVGIHDATGSHKRLVVRAREEGVSITCTHVAAEADTANGRYAPDFHVAVGPFDGDYWEAAQIYRRFTRHTPWGRAGTTSPQADASASQARPVAGNEPAQRSPQWLRDIDLWFIVDGDPLAKVETCQSAQAFFDTPIGLHLYNWHEIPFDTLYPEYFPPKPGFREGVAKLQQAGLRVTPYINGRLCDPNSKTWKEEGGEAASALDPEGKPYTEVYGSKVPLHVMCPATTFWRDKVSGIVDRLIREYNVDGVYIDQITAAHAVQCMRTDHGHSPGGGVFWSEGYRRMLDQIRERLPEGRILTSEENAECWNDQFDALLMVNTPAVGGRRIIPLMPTVYAGRVITFGFQYMAADDVPRSLPFRAKMARCFLFGAQLGWIKTELVMAETARVEAEFLRNLARARQGAHAFLLDGAFLGEVEATGDVPRLQGEGGSGGGKYTIDLPAVMATAWMAQDGTLALAAVNMSDVERTVDLPVPWERAAKAEFGPAATHGPRPAQVRVTIPPTDARVVRIDSTKP
ncbi:MAG: hypothetical protein GXY55_15500 [Phycisphaerae bacterium]|nr:hypothetical protein [Phycisphaerae bacterium]